MATDIENRIIKMMPDLKKRAMVLAKNREWVDDLVQDTVTRAIEKQHLFKEGTNLDAWMFTMMRNLFNTFLYKKLGYKHDKPIIAVDIHPGAKSYEPEMGHEDFTIVHEHLSCLKQFNEDYYEVLMLRYKEDLTTKEIVTRLSKPPFNPMTPGTVMSRVERGKKFMKNLLVLKQADDENAINVDGKKFPFWGGIYFHGATEDWVYERTKKISSGAPDLICASKQLIEVEDGVHKCAIYGKLAYLYLWTAKQIVKDEVIVEHERRCGLVVFEDDTEHKDDATKKFKNKVRYL